MGVPANEITHVGSEDAKISEVSDSDPQNNKYSAQILLNYRPPAPHHGLLVPASTRA